MLRGLDGIPCVRLDTRFGCNAYEIDLRERVGAIHFKRCFERSQHEGHAIDPRIAPIMKMLLEELAQAFVPEIGVVDGNRSFEPVPTVRS